MRGRARLTSGLDGGGQALQQVDGVVLPWRRHLGLAGQQRDLAQQAAQVRGLHGAAERAEVHRQALRDARLRRQRARRARMHDDRVSVGGLEGAGGAPGRGEG